MKRLWVIGGGPSTEFDVSLASARMVCENLNLDHYVVVPVVITKSFRWMIAGKEITKDGDNAWVPYFFERATDSGATLASFSLGEAITRMTRDGVACVFLALHGQYGEDGRIQGLLEMAGVPYTGSGILASATAFSKSATIAAYRQAGLPTAPSVVVRSPDEAAVRARDISYPVFVKPVRGGSSVGVAMCASAENLDDSVKLALTADSEVLIEQRIEGTEISCGVVETAFEGKFRATALPPTEIRPVGTSFFDYDAKYKSGGSEEITPARLPAQMITRIQHFAERAHKVLGCAGMSRTDMIVPNDPTADPILLETNTIPGLTPTSLLPQQARAAGISVADLLGGIVEHGIARGSEASGSPPLPS